MADWEQIYKNKCVEESTPAAVLITNQYLLPTHGKALDFASGLSANGVFMAQRGLDVTAWDRSEVAVNKVNAYADEFNLSLHAEKKDLENDDEKLTGKFDVVVVSYFLYRKSLSKLVALLKPGGILFYQTFSGDQLNGVGPSRADFRLKRGELLKAFENLSLLFYREDNCSPETEGANVGQVYFVAQK